MGSAGLIGRLQGVKILRQGVNPPHAGPLHRTPHPAAAADMRNKLTAGHRHGRITKIPGQAQPAQVPGGGRSGADVVVIIVLHYNTKTDDEQKRKKYGSNE